jgi:hypothetical protein
MKVRIMSPGIGYGTRLWFNDQEVLDVSNIEVSIPVDGVVRTTVEQLASDGLELTADDSQVVLNLRTFPGFEIQQTDNPDGTRTFRVVKQEA